MLRTETVIPQLTTNESLWIAERIDGVEDVYNLPYSKRFESMHTDFVATFGRPITRNELWIAGLANTSY